MSEFARSSIERLQRLHAVMQQRFEISEAIAEEIHSLTERIARSTTQEDRLVLGRAARVSAYEDPSLEDSAQVWIPALSLRDGLGVVLVDLHEFSYLQQQVTRLEDATHNQFLAFEHCTMAMRSTVLAQLPGLVDRMLLVLAIGQS